MGVGEAPPSITKLVTTCLLEKNVSKFLRFCAGFKFAYMTKL